MTRWSALATILALGYATPVLAESASVKYRGPVPLDTFQCTDITESKFIKRICYDKDKTYLLIQLGDDYHQYCAVDETTESQLLASNEIGHFYNTTIRHHFSCRDTVPPTY